MGQKIFTKNKWCISGPKMYEGFLYGPLSINHLHHRTRPNHWEFLLDIYL